MYITGTLKTHFIFQNVLESKTRHVQVLKWGSHPVVRLTVEIRRLQTASQLTTVLPHQIWTNPVPKM